MTAPPPLNVDSVQRRLVAIRDRLGELGQVDNLTVERLRDDWMLRP